MELLKTPQVIR